MKANNQFTEGKILGPLVKSALPVLLALCLQAVICGRRHHQSEKKSCRRRLWTEKR